jgi:hypothetical protein
MHAPVAELEIEVVRAGKIVGRDRERCEEKRRGKNSQEKTDVLHEKISVDVCAAL